jgi:hypothetical protein
MGAEKVVVYSKNKLFLKEMIRSENQASLFLEIDSRRTLSKAIEL